AQDSRSLCSPQMRPAFRSLVQVPRTIASYAARICFAALANGISPTPVPKPGVRIEAIRDFAFVLYLRTAISAARKAKYTLTVLDMVEGILIVGALTSHGMPLWPVGTSTA